MNGVFIAICSLIGAMYLILAVAALAGRSRQDEITISRNSVVLYATLYVGLLGWLAAAGASTAAAGLVTAGAALSLAFDVAMAGRAFSYRLPHLLYGVLCSGLLLAGWAIS